MMIMAVIMVITGIQNDADDDDDDTPIRVSSGCLSPVLFFDICLFLPATQLNSAWPSLHGYWVGAMSTSQRAVMPCGWGVKAGMVIV